MQLISKNRFSRLITLIFIVLGAMQFCMAQIKVGAEDYSKVLKLLATKKVGLVVNQTSMIGNTHLVDTLLRSKINVVRIFGPEHGFRGTADAGEKINNSIDAKTNIPVVSLYGKNKKPTSEQMADLDMIVFDIQDVGCRFYTYISTLHYVMEACSEANVPLLVLDRPNPNGMYVDGPVLDTAYRSFVGMHPVPVVHGMTIGEYAKMIIGEKWIAKTCSLEVIKCQNYTHTSTYTLPIKPSPNLPNDLSIALYPSLCLFEGTAVSVARGTLFPFQAIGMPDSTLKYPFEFTPKSIEGMSKDPMHRDKKCLGVDLRNTPIKREFTLKYVIELYQNCSKKEAYFNNFFKKLIGNEQVMQQIKQEKTEQEIRSSWKLNLDRYKEMRKKYLLYSEN